MACNLFFQTFRSRDNDFRTFINFKMFWGIYLVPVENQSLAAPDREIIVMKSIIYVSETANHPIPPKKTQNPNPEKLLHGP